MAEGFVYMITGHEEMGPFVFPQFICVVIIASLVFTEV